MFLTDADLDGRRNSLFRNLKPATTPFGEDDPVQPCSVDLTIGEIYVPGTPAGQPGSAGNARIELLLDPGQTAVVVTAETIDFPHDVGAIGFPPASLAGSGLLMTNPGHVDPGYFGAMHFTVINMARKPVLLRQGERIVTLVVFETSHPVQRDWRTREGTTRDISREDLDHLSPDFLDVRGRAEKAVASAEERIRRHIDTEDRKTRFWVIGAPILAVVVTIGATVVGAWATGQLSTAGRIDQLERRASDLEQQVGSNPGAKASLKERVEKLEMCSTKHPAKPCP